MQTFWDQNFSAAGHKYGTEPNVFLTQQAHLFAAQGQVLVPGDGEGRNSVWLAQQGHSVTAMDSSTVGMAKARALAAERGAHIETVLGDLADWTPESATFDALVLTYVHLPPAIRQGAHRRLVHALRPGGWLVLECFHPAQLSHRSGGPKDPAMLCTVDLLRDDLSGLMDEALAWSGECELAEGGGHQGLAHVTRWVGQRRAIDAKAEA